MIWKIIFLLSFFNVLINAGLPDTNEPMQDAVKGKDVKDEWQKKFSKYDEDNDRSISPEELQKLLFNESKGFITIQQAKKFIPLLDTGGDGKIRFHQLEKIEPIMDILSQRETLSLENNDEVDDSATTSDSDIKAIMFGEFKGIFESPDEVQEIIDFFVKDDKGGINNEQGEEIVDILESTYKLYKAVEIFSILNTFGVITNKDIKGLVDLANFAKKLKNQTSDESDDSEKITEFIKTFDENGDGRIEFFEFLKKCSHLNKDELFKIENFFSSLRVPEAAFINDI